MKKRILTIAAVFMVIAMIFAAAGCEFPFGEKQEPAPDIDPADLLGTWDRINANTHEIYIFNENMTYTQNQDGSISRGDYSVSGNTLETVSDLNKKRTHVVRFSEDKNTMTWGDGPVTADYARRVK